MLLNMCLLVQSNNSRTAFEWFYPSSSTVYRYNWYYKCRFDSNVRVSTRFLIMTNVQALHIGRRTSLPLKQCVVTACVGTLQ